MERRTLLQASGSTLAAAVAGCTSTRPATTEREARSTATEVEPVWSYDGLFHRVLARLAVAGDYVYLPLQDGAVALDRDDGTPSIEFPFSAEWLTVVGDSVYFLSEMGEKSPDYYAIAATVGASERRWRWGDVSKVPRVSGDAVLLPETERLSAVHVDDGSERWTQSFEPGFQLRATTDRTTYVTGHTERGDDVLHALNTATGTTRWGREDVVVGAAADALVGENHVYVVDSGSKEDPGHLWALDRDDGSTTWHVRLAVERIVWISRLVDDTLFVRDSSATVHAVDPADGSTRWSVEGRYVGYHEGTVVTQRGDEAVGRSAEDGDVQWTHRADRFTDEDSEPLMRLASGEVVVVAAGELGGLDPATGEPNWWHHVRRLEEAEDVVVADRCYVVDGDKAYAFPRK